MTRKDLYVTTKVPGCLTKVGCRASVLRNHASIYNDFDINLTRLSSRASTSAVSPVPRPVVYTVPTRRRSMLRQPDRRTLGSPVLCPCCVESGASGNLKQLGLASVNMLLVHYSSPTAKKCDCDSQ